MKTASTRIAMAQINTTVGDIIGNRDKIASCIERAQHAGADIVVFPELAICGYPPEDLLLKEHFIDDIQRALEFIAKKTAKTCAIVGFVDRDKQKKLYNAAAVIKEGAVAGAYHKMRLPNYGVFDERRYFIEGGQNKVFKIGETIFGVSICEDIWADDGPHTWQVKEGAQLLINISASPYHMGKIAQRHKMLASRARQLKTGLCYTNLVGGQDELIFDGGSLLLDQEGNIIACAKQFAEDFLIAESCDHGRTILPHEPGGLEEVYSALVLGTRDYVRKNGFKKVVIGLSGGIDSSFTAMVACDALGKENVVGVSMPSRYSSDETKHDARAVAHNLGIQFFVMPIDSVFSIYMMVLEKEFTGLGRDTTEENLQARIRANILMALSNKFGWLVLATGNKSEIATGYCTLYGDMAGGFAALKDVPKTLVYRLAEFRNKKAPGCIIPPSVFQRAPMAELKYGQKDSDTLPPYETLDPILKEYVEENKGIADIISQQRDAAVVKKVVEMVDKSEYKRRQAPPGVKITPTAFGKDRRLPITNAYKEY